MFQDLSVFVQDQQKKKKDRFKQVNMSTWILLLSNVTNYFGGDLFKIDILNEIGLYLENSQKSLIFLARQNKLLEVINSMAIIESEMMSHQQLFLSSQGT